MLTGSKSYTLILISVFWRERVERWFEDAFLDGFGRADEDIVDGSDVCEGRGIGGETEDRVCEGPARWVVKVEGI